MTARHVVKTYAARTWLLWHMRHPYLDLTGRRWRCSCGSTWSKP